MIFPQNSLEYLSGKSFSNGINIQISMPEKDVLWRIDFLESILKNKKVIHVGCVDHVPLIERKIKENTWLHKRLTSITERCLGIDIDSEGINYIKSLGIDDVFCVNLITDPLPGEVTDTKWDYILLGEILEHVDNPVQFLESISEKCSPYVERIIITVPYAFGLSNFKRAIKHTEFINSDHRYWFTPYTLAKVIKQSGITVESFQICHSYKLSKYSVVNRFLLSRYPALRDNLVMIAKM